MRVFKDYGFKINCKTNLHIVNFLDIYPRFCNNTYELYKKPDNHLVYINKNSNHPEKFEAVNQIN